LNAHLIQPEFLGVNEVNAVLGLVRTTLVLVEFKLHPRLSRPFQYRKYTETTRVCSRLGHTRAAAGNLGLADGSPELFGVERGMQLGDAQRGEGVEDGVDERWRHANRAGLADAFHA